MRCEDHGALMKSEWCICLTNEVLNLVESERQRQFELHGANLENPSGTGPRVRWAACLAGYTNAPAEILENVLRADYEASEEDGEKVTWLKILLEEFSEVAKETDRDRLITELVQVAAVAVSWVEKLMDPESVIGPRG